VHTLALAYLFSMTSNDLGHTVLYNPVYLNRNNMYLLNLSFFQLEFVLHRLKLNVNTSNLSTNKPSTLLLD